MPCNNPLIAYKDAVRGISFKHNAGGAQLRLPCGQCHGCRLDYSYMWATRIIHEAQMHDVNCFVTLTYREAPPTLIKRDVQLFLKRLRKTHTPHTLRFYCAGEHGELTGRPHYHLCLFGIDFPDRRHYKTTALGHHLWTSATLDKLWGHGMAVIGDLNAATAAYTARYVMKKLKGRNTKEREIVNVDTGEIHKRANEFAHMSLRPAIGLEWLHKYYTDVYPHGYVISNGHKIKPPRYYEIKHADINPDEHEKLTDERYLRHRDNPQEDTPERRHAKERILRAKLNLVPRSIE